MDPYDTRISIDKVLLQDKKWLDAINTASVTVKDKDGDRPCISKLRGIGDIQQICSEDKRAWIPRRKT